ncbi:MAG: esterase [Verrucomicrobia bacterium]|nr:esterase [Verrucomicrobiota bacterium]
MNAKPSLLPLITAVLSLSFAVSAQAPRREPTPNDTLKSPEVLSDSRVAFRIYAPKASEVTIGGDWIAQGLGTGGKLTKEDNGVWSIIVGPLPPDFYSYSFTVDGVRTLDPKNPMIKQGISSLDNMFFLPGKEAAFEDNRPVPHGKIHLEWYQSTTLGTQRRLHIYTPPGYDSGREPLPVFYLLHGGGDEDSGWSTIGRAGFILDNLLAENKAKPMIIAMPNGSLPRPANLPAFTPGTAPSPEAVAAMAAAQERFTSELMKDIVPYVEKNYRVLANRENRAIAGLSMGGGQTLRVLTSHADQFGYVAIWSAGIGQNAADFEKRNEAFLKAAEKINQQVKLLSISVGDKDFALNGSKNLADLLKKNGIQHELQISGGGHTWINWRRYLNELAPRLFR